MFLILTWLIVRLLCDLCFMKRCCFFGLIIVNDDCVDDSFDDHALLFVWM